MIKKILISDSQPICAHGMLSLITNLNQTFDCLNLVDNLKTTFDYLSTYSPQLLIIDASVFDYRGINVVKDIKKHNKFIKILVTNCSQNNQLAIQSLKSGAHGFINKNDSLETIEKAVLRVVNGGIYLGKQLSDELSRTTF